MKPLQYQYYCRVHFVQYQCWALIFAGQVCCYLEESYSSYMPFINRMSLVSYWAWVLSVWGSLIVHVLLWPCKEFRSNIANILSDVALTILANINTERVVCVSSHYPMTWLYTIRILYHGILQCRSPQCRDLPSVAMGILLLLVMSTMVSWQHQQQTMDGMMSQSYLWHHNGLECCDIKNMP